MPHVYAGSAAYPADTVRPVLTIGNFDGLHLGHRHLVNTLVSKAKEFNTQSVVYTFDPPPRVVLAPEKHDPRIQTWPDKVRIMGELGVDHVVVERFTRAFAQHPPSWFLEEVLARRIQPQAIVVGYDFRFGRNREGDINTLRNAFPSLPVTQLEALQLDGEVISSSRIRSLVSEGHVDKAATLLGCPHRIQGTVVHGDARGRTMGFPTANLQTDADLQPNQGVYAVRARLERGKWFNAVANLGTRPTFDGRGFLIEVHVLDFSGNLYGAEMEIEFIQRLRGEQTFDGPTALASQIQLDILNARKVLKT